MITEQDIVDLHNSSGRQFNGLTVEELAERFEQMTVLAQKCLKERDAYHELAIAYGVSLGRQITFQGTEEIKREIENKAQKILDAQKEKA